jgi:parvulin-like peptidyl-prolyl isomerase
MPITPDVVASIAAAGRGGGPPARGQMPDSSTAPGGLPRLADRPGDSTARIAATVNGEAILEEEVRIAAIGELAEANSLTEPERSRKIEEIHKRALNALIERELVIQDALAKLANAPQKTGMRFIEKLKEAANKEFTQQWLNGVKKSWNVTDDEQVKTVLRSQGLSLEIIQRGWERNFMKMEYLKQRIFPYLDQLGYTDLKEYYERHPEEFQVTDSVDWQDLFIDAGRHPDRVSARQFADGLLVRIQKGEDFAKMAATFDNGRSRSQPGAKGIGEKRGEILPSEVEPILFQLNARELGPVIEVPNGFHIVRVVSRQHAGLLPLDEKVQKQIRDKLRNEIGQREMKRIVNDLRQKAIIEYAQH